MNMNFHAKTELDMIGYDIRTFDFNVDMDSSYFIVNDHNEPLRGFDLEILSHVDGYNKQITNGEFSIRLIRKKNMCKVNQSDSLDLTIGICTFPNNKCVKTMKVKIN